MADIRMGDIGTILEVQILEENNPSNLTSVADIWLVIIKPDKTVITRKKSLGELAVSVPLEGKITFTAPAGLWDMSGVYQAYPIIKFIVGVSEYSGNVFTWIVQPIGT